MKKTIYLFLFFLLNVPVFSQTPYDSIKFKQNPNYILETGLYDIYKLKQADIVMLGNSITHGVNWNELLGRNDIVERGVPSDVVEGYRSRIKYVFDLKPKVVFVMGGINDIYSWVSVDDIFKTYVKLVNELKAKNITVVIQSTLYVSYRWNFAEDRNKEVEKLDKLLSDYAAANNINYIDLNSRMSYNKSLIDDLTYDGVHLNAKGFKIWGREVEKMLSKLGM